MCPGDSRSFGPVKFALLSTLSKPLLYFFAGGQKNRGDQTHIELFVSGCCEIYFMIKSWVH